MRLSLFFLILLPCWRFFLLKICIIFLLEWIFFSSATSCLCLRLSFCEACSSFFSSFIYDLACFRGFFCFFSSSSCVVPFLLSSWLWGLLSFFSFLLWPHSSLFGLTKMDPMLLNNAWSLLFFTMNVGGRIQVDFCTVKRSRGNRAEKS